MQSTRPPLALAGVDDAARTKQRSRGGGGRRCVKQLALRPLAHPPPHCLTRGGLSAPGPGP